MPIRITGLNSGLDTEAIISALVSSYNYKTISTRKTDQAFLEQGAWKTLNTKIISLYSSVGNLKLSSAYNLKSTTVSDTTKATVTASNSAPSGTQSLNIISVAQAGYPEPAVSWIAACQPVPHWQNSAIPVGTVR